MLKKWYIICLIFLILPILSIFLKIFYFDYEISDVIPDKGYKLVLEIISHTDSPKSISISTFAPINNLKQRVLKEEGFSDAFNFRLQKEDSNRVMSWTGDRLVGENKMRYTVQLKAKAIQYAFLPDTPIDTNYPPVMNKYLESTETIQTTSEAIKKKAQRLTRNKHTLYDKIKAIHNFVIKKIKYVNFSGGLDAESTLQILEASCNGKSRLYAAMIRGLGIPARLVGGIILNKSPKKVIHQWLEIYLQGNWVPFCPTNNYFAELPNRYITLYYGDKVLFTYKSKIKLDYSYSFEKITIPKTGLSNKFKDLPINIFAIMDNFEKFNISLNIFIYLLMLPLAAVILVILRNVFGLETFGTFLPILIASVLGGTGVTLGIALFFTIIFVVYLGNLLLSKLEILYHPRMAILLSLVIAVMITVFYFGLLGKNYDVISLVFFPVAIMAITINRVTVIMEEDGVKRLFVMTFNTVLVILISYYFINSLFLQLMMLSFPELISFFIGLNILIGRWSGFRLTEFVRFRGFFMGQQYDR